MGERIWYEDVYGFVRRFDRFWPTKTMTFVEQLNALVRLSAYFAALVAVFKRSLLYFFVPLAMGAFTFLLFRHDVGRKYLETWALRAASRGKDPVTGKTCIVPTADNPFMNVLVSDYALDPQRPSACDIQRPSISKMAKQHFDHRLFRSVHDVFDKEASDRQFYTNPVTTIPNDQTGFANWCYKTPKTCKEGNGLKCHANMYRRVVH